MLQQRAREISSAGRRMSGWMALRALGLDIRLAGWHPFREGLASMLLCVLARCTSCAHNQWFGPKHLLASQLVSRSGLFMAKLWFVVSAVVLLFSAAVALSCGTSSQGPSQLQSIALNPPTADAQSYPDGVVPFTATGYYTNPTHSVTPQAAKWVACQDETPTTAVSVTSTGAAQCAGGSSGVYAINAWSVSNAECTAITACGGGCTVVGSAQLTCP